MVNILILFGQLEFFYRNNIDIHKEIIKGILLQIMSSPQELQVTQLTNEL